MFKIEVKEGFYGGTFTQVKLLVSFTNYLDRCRHQMEMLTSINKAKGE